MLTGKMVRVRFARNNVVPIYLDEADAEWLSTAERLLEIYRGHQGMTRRELQEEIAENFGDLPNPQIHQGLAKLLEDRSEFEVVSEHSPEEIRAAVFVKATECRQQAASRERERTEDSASRERERPEQAPSEALGTHRPPPVGFWECGFDRKKVLEQVAKELQISADEIERCLFADLKSEQHLVKFKDISGERLLERYNVGLAQAVLLRATAVRVTIRGEPPKRWRQLLRRIKFHGLLCEFERLPDDAWLLKLDGPLSLFLSTQKYGLQLAMFLPVVLQCKNFDLEADLLWGPQRRPRKFQLNHADGLTSHYADRGVYLPPEFAMFAGLFREKITDWEIRVEAELLTLGDGFWAPDFQLVHVNTGQAVYLEILGFWRRSSVLKHLDRLREHAAVPFVLAISEQLGVGEEELKGLPASVQRFRQMPLPSKIAEAAEELLGKAQKTPGSEH